MTAIANSHEQADQLYAHTLEVLDAETAYLHAATREDFESMVSEEFLEEAQ